MSKFNVYVLLVLVAPLVRLPDSGIGLWHKTVLATSMCGILATIQSVSTGIVSDDFKATWDALRAAVAARGTIF